MSIAGASSLVERGIYAGSYSSCVSSACVRVGGWIRGARVGIPARAFTGCSHRVGTGANRGGGGCSVGRSRSVANWLLVVHLMAGGA